jgi:hypothetical protein
VLLHLAWLRQDEADSAQRWLDRAVETYADGTPRLRPVGEILKKGRQVTAEDIVRFDAPFTEKVPALVALAAACEARRAELLDLAEKLNFARAYPHRFLRATIAELRGRGNE